MKDTTEMTAIQLLPCPFCGGNPEKKCIGNDFTRKRSVEIKCTKCFTKQVTGAIRNTMQWCEENAIKQWNTREYAATKEPPQWISVEEGGILPSLDEQVETEGKDGRHIAFFCRNANGTPMWIVSFAKADDMHIYTPIKWRKLQP